MKKAELAVVIVLVCVAGMLSQKPSDPTLLIPQEGPAFDLTPVPNPLTFPAGIVMGYPGDLEFDSKGHLWVISRPIMGTPAGTPTQPIVEFDETLKYIRSFG